MTLRQLRAYAPVAGSSVIALTTWLAVLSLTDNRPDAAVPPFDDGLRHGWITARWLALGDVDPAAVLTNDAIGSVPERGSSPYPLALSLLAGTISRMSGATVAAGLNAVVVLAAVIWLPLAAWAFARAVFPRDTLTARAIPMVSLAMPVAYYSSWTYGGLPFLVAGVGLLAVGAAGP